jgi:Domain of unknown function (DUF222)
MSIQQLPAPAVTELLAGARSAVRAASRVPVGALSVDEIADGLADCAMLETRLAALRLSLVAEADRRKVAQSLGDTGTDAWAARLTGSTRAVMAGGVWLARMLDERYGATREAFAEGALNEDQARVIVSAAERLPAGVDDEQRRAAEAALVVKAVNGMDARRLRQAARRMLDVVSVELADRHEADLLERESRRAEIETWLSLQDNGDGTYAGRFMIPELHGLMLRAWLESTTSPSRLAHNRAGALVTDDTLPTGGGHLSWTERLGLGLTELIEHLPEDLSGPVAATVIVTMDLEHLRDGLASASIDGGARVSAGDARRLACGAGLVPAVLGGGSVPLDLGDSRRLHSRHQRRALRLMHETCAAEGCERPFAWCDIHHPHWWSKGGPTDLANGLPLCGHHHRRAHDSRFQLDRLPSGEVRFTRRR